MRWRRKNEMIPNKEWEKVKKGSVDYQEIVKDFTGLIFHCPNCDAEMHLHIAKIDFEPIKINKIKNVKKR